MQGATDPEGRAWSWFISLAAVGLFAWGVAELLGVGAGDSVATTSAQITADLGSSGSRESVVELHHLLPDATDDLGRLVSVDGTVVGDTSPSGFWVRDLRDNIVFVGEESGGRTLVEAGEAVRVVGRIALLPPGEQANRLERAGLVVPTNAVVIRDVKVLPMTDGIEVLRE